MQKTYWHLLDRRRLPTDYEVASTRLHYYLGRDFEVQVPMGTWYDVHQRQCPLVCHDWDQFEDPRQLTYAAYVAQQAKKEHFVDGLWGAMERDDYQNNLTADWRAYMAFVLTPLRFPCHALQMTASYMGSMAPGSRLTIAAALQAADEMRRVHRLAYHMAFWRRCDPSYGHNATALWQEHPAWQALRRLCEELLTVYDWGEALAALNLGVKPVFDDFCVRGMADLARAQHDHLWAEILGSLAEDSQWHQQWSNAWLLMLSREQATNGEIVESWAAPWRARTEEALQLLAEASPQLG